MAEFINTGHEWAVSEIIGASEDTGTGRYSINDLEKRAMGSRMGVTASIHATQAMTKGAYSPNALTNAYFRWKETPTTGYQWKGQLAQAWLVDGNEYITLQNPAYAASDFTEGDGSWVYSITGTLAILATDVSNYEYDGTLEFEVVDYNSGTPQALSPPLIATQQLQTQTTNKQYLNFHFLTRQARAFTITARAIIRCPDGGATTSATIQTDTNMIVMAEYYNNDQD